MNSAIQTETADRWSLREFIATSLRVTQWTFAVLRFLLLLGCVFLVTWVVNYNPVSWDLTESKLFSISEQSVATLEALSGPITLTAFVDKGSNPAVERILRAYGDKSALVDYRLVDPEAEPALAAELQVAEYGVLIVEGADRVQRAELIREPEITNAILRVDRGAAVPVCFTIGHGERAIEDTERGGLSAAATAMAQTNYRVQPLNLAADTLTPDECRVLVIAGPSVDFDAVERDLLERYLDDGGRLMALLDSGPELPELAALLSRYGLRAGNDFVIDTRRNAQAFGGGVQVPVIDAYAEHPVTENFRLMTMFNMPRSVAIADDVPESFEARALASTTQSSWGETNFDRSVGATYDEGAEARGPLSIVAAVGTRVEETPQQYRNRMRAGDPAPIGEPILVAAGDVDFAANAFFQWQGNGDLLLNSVNWLAGQQDLISIRPKEVANKRVLLTDARKALTFLLVVILLPALPAVAGVLTMIKKVK